VAYITTHGRILPAPLAVPQRMTTNTLLIGEITGASGNDGAGDPVEIGYSWVTRDVQGVDEGINGPGTVPGGRSSRDPLGGGENRHGEMYREIGFSAFHPGGAHFAMADASVHFISDNIDQFVLEAMASRDRGEVVESGF